MGHILLQILSLMTIDLILHNILNSGSRGRKVGAAVGGKQTIQLNDAFNVFKKIKGTPKFWQNARSELVAKVKQLGPFHIFYTFSCGEMRWPEIFLSIFQRNGYKITKPDNFDGHDEDLLVEGIPLWQYVNEKMSSSKHAFFQDYTFLITIMFDERVKSFVKNILMGNANDQVKLDYFSYRVEFQARGFPHIHGVAWIQKEYLEMKGLDPLNLSNNIHDGNTALAELANEWVSCELPKNDANGEKLYGKPSLGKIVSEVQIHHHTKSCLKRNGQCRYNFPRLPCRETVVARPIDQQDDKANWDMDRKKKFLEDAKKTLKQAKEELEKEDLNQNISLDDFCKILGVETNRYMDYMQTTEKGVVLILKRSVKERYVNNYNPEMLNAWNANMDIQLALNPYAVIAYIVNYVNKDETGMTKFLTEVLKQNASKDLREKLNKLKLAYFNHRQIGASEACYRVSNRMYLKHSNIATIFVPTGFPENRSVLFRKVPDNGVQKTHARDYTESSESESDVDDYDHCTEKNVNTYQDETVEIEGRDGNYKQALTMIDRYAARPEYLEQICLAQFATSYVHIDAKNLPKKAIFEEQGKEV